MPEPEQQAQQLTPEQALERIVAWDDAEKPHMNMPLLDCAELARRTLAVRVAGCPDEGQRERVVESFAEVLWAWSWTVDQGKQHKPYPYGRLIEATKEDLRAIAGGIIRGPDEYVSALAEIAAIQADCDQAKWMRDRAQAALGAVAASPDEGQTPRDDDERKGFAGFEERMAVREITGRLEDEEAAEKKCPRCGKVILVPGRHYEIAPSAVCRCRAAGPADEGLRAGLKAALFAIELYSEAFHEGPGWRGVRMEAHAQETFARAALDAAAGCLPEEPTEAQIDAAYELLSMREPEREDVHGALIAVFAMRPGPVGDKDPT